MKKLRKRKNKLDMLAIFLKINQYILLFIKEKTWQNKLKMSQIGRKLKK